jgi:hypothetical protein
MIGLYGFTFLSYRTQGPFHAAPSSMTYYASKGSQYGKCPSVEIAEGHLLHIEAYHHDVRIFAQSTDINSRANKDQRKKRTPKR